MCFASWKKMKSQGGYVPPPYIPLGQSDSEAEIVPHKGLAVSHHLNDSPVQWASGICACCDDMQSCMLLYALWPWFYQKENYEGAT